MEFITGIPMQRKAPKTGGRYQLTETGNKAYINPSAIESAVYDPQEDATAIKLIRSGTNAVLKGDVMREYEGRMKGRHQGDGRED